MLRVLKIFAVFLVAFSLASLTGPMSGNFHLPYIQSVRAIPQAPCPVPLSGGGCSDYWVAAGPAEDTFVATIFTDEQSEFSDIQSATPHIDFTDWQLFPNLISPFCNGANFQCTSSISLAGNFEVQFMLANNFWGVNMNFGNNPNGTQIRQGIWHMIDTALFASKEPSLSGQGVALDTPNPTDNIGSLPIPNPCTWDLMFPETGSQCVVGALGGTAYHLASATGANGTPWLQAPGSADLDAAAAHFVAAGVASGCDGGTGTSSCIASKDSILSGISSAASAHVPNFFIRNDNPPRLDLGNTIAEQICYMFTGSYNIPCPYLSDTQGPITAFPGFTTSTTSVNLSWGMYTAAYGSPTGPLPFDSTYYLTYNSRFVSGIPSIQPPNGPCVSTAVPTVSAPDYPYLCNPNYDSLSTQMEFAPCLSIPGQSPAIGEIDAAYGGCPGSGAESVVNATATTYAGQPVLYGQAPPTGASLASTTTLKLGCSTGYILKKNVTPPPLWVCTSPGGINLPASVIFTPASHSAYVPSAGDILVHGPALPPSSPLTAMTGIKFYDANKNGIFDPGQFDAISAGVQAADIFGQNAFTIEVFEQNAQFGYLNNGWTRVVNNIGAGLPNYFTWLDAWNNPSNAGIQGFTPGTIRQGFKQTTTSVNPYVAGTIWDFYILSNIYDSLTALNPLSGNQMMDWMSVSISQLSNSALTYTPPNGTTASFRFTLRSDMFWQDGRRVTPWDVKFSYQTLLATGAFQGGGLTPVTGITVLGTEQLDVNVRAVGPFTLLSLTSPTILPGRYWSTCPGSVWDGYVGINNVPNTCLRVDPNKITASYDPLANGILVGSGAWMCKSGTGTIGSGCSSSGQMNPPVGGSYLLTRFGKGLVPGSSIPNIYFRSNGNLATYLWSQDNGDITHDFLNFAVAASCFGSSSLSCNHWMTGIGGCGGTATSTCTVGLQQVAIVNRFVGLNWVAPFNWTANPPLGIVPLDPVLYENTLTLNPASLAGCSTAYPTGGYDC